MFPESCSGDWDLTGSLDVVLQDNAFGAIELTWIKDGTIRRKAAEKLRVSGLQVMFSGGPAFSGSGFSLCSVDESDRLQAVAFANYLVDMACELGGRNLLVPSGPDPGGVAIAALDASGGRSLRSAGTAASVAPKTRWWSRLNLSIATWIAANW